MPVSTHHVVVASSCFPAQNQHLFDHLFDHLSVRLALRWRGTLLSARWSYMTGRGRGSPSRILDSSRLRVP
eukprot:SAG31_NODE_24491_length_480_cov_0.955381_1_plen_70_part_10